MITISEGPSLLDLYEKVERVMHIYKIRSKTSGLFFNGSYFTKDGKAYSRRGYAQQAFDRLTRWDNAEIVAFELKEVK